MKDDILQDCLFDCSPLKGSIVRCRLYHGEYDCGPVDIELMLAGENLPLPGTPGLR